MQRDDGLLPAEGLPTTRSPASEGEGVPPSSADPGPPPPAAGVQAPPPGPAGRRLPQPGFWWALVWCFGFVILTQGPGGAVAAAILLGGAVLQPDSLPPEVVADQKALLKAPLFSAALMAAFAVSQVLVIGLSVLALRLAAGPEWPRQVALRRPGLAHTLLAVLALPALVLLANGSYALLREVFGLPSFSDWVGAGMEEMVGVFGAWPWPVAVLLIGVGPGVGEELWCRGLLGRGLVARYGPVGGVLLTSFFFGLIHVDPAQGTMAALLGVCLHYVYLTTRSLWLPMLLHFLNNSLAVTLARFPDLAALEKEASSLPVLVYAAAGLLLAAVAWALFATRVRAVGPDGGEVRPAYPTVASPPAGGGLILESRRDPAALGLAFAAFLAFAAACAIATLRG